VDYLDAVRTLVGGQSGKGGNVSLATGVATADSADGKVIVDFGGVTVSPSGGQSVTVPTTTAVKAGDTVQVSLDGADGTGKTPLVYGVVGGGDRVLSEMRDTASGLESKITQNAESVTTAITTANGAKSTADETATMIRAYQGGALVCKTGSAVGALVNADGSFQVVEVTWNGSTPTVGAVISNMDSDSIDLAIGQASSVITMCGGKGRVAFNSGAGQVFIQGTGGTVLSYDPGTGVFPDIGIGITKNGGSEGDQWQVYCSGNMTIGGGNLAVSSGSITQRGLPVLSPRVLYSVTSPNWYKVTLSDSVANYRMVSVVYQDTDGYMGTAYAGDGVNIGSPDGKSVSCFTAGMTDDAVYGKCKTYGLSGNTVNAVKGSSAYQTCQFTVTNSWCDYENADYIGIVAVYGWL
jgi:hypothetical protein